MHLDFIDWAIIAAYLLLSLFIGLKYRKQAGKSIADFFLGGRNLPWHIAGISMVATTFAADTPLAVTELVAKNGISGNWLWWNMLIGGMLTTFFFAKLWRRAEVLTELEFIELRYSGKPAAFLRGFKAVYLGIFMNVMILGWVNLAMMSIIEIFFGDALMQSGFLAATSSHLSTIFGITVSPSLVVTGLLMLIAAFYSSLSGLWGVAITDVIQFFIAMTGCIVLAVIVVSSEKIGGIEGLKSQLPSGTLDFFPAIGKEGSGAALALGIGSFLAYITVQWWASWYPGAEPGGGGYVAQRMMSAKDEKHSLFATLFFQIAHYCIRPWPWIIVALCAMVLYPDLTDPKEGYVLAMRDFLPVGLKGLLLVAFFAAYMSTISTQLNWGASFIVNDLYKRFMKPESNEKQLVSTGRIATILLMLISLGVTTQINSISGVWQFIMECGAGLGMVLILRWYWWRINAWSEIVATIIPFLVFGTLKTIEYLKLIPLHKIYGENIPKEVIDVFYAQHPYLIFPGSFFITVGITTLGWLLITFLTHPTEQVQLKTFYNKVKPSGWWKNARGFSEQNEEISDAGLLKDSTINHQPSSITHLFICWFSAVAMTYSILFFTGKVIFHEWKTAAIWFIAALAAFIILRISLQRSKMLE
ncbi:MAG: sodium:proline symporter [Flavobacteriales bacterium]|nr:MAG: sodium:proline symporter [Flavobacteriales bacterium]